MQLTQGEPGWNPYPQSPHTVGVNDSISAVITGGPETCPTAGST